MTRFLVKVSSPEGLKRLIESGRFTLQESVIVDVLRRADGPGSVKNTRSCTGFFATTFRKQGR
ncbi:hypothetical protein [Alloalcanivorax marinus]|uniref:hypothetical protein n=1 Tax=Alloalcanivorax marinus TaxID=1177169 RepID=UPI001932B183|nr:hypothetical protein [Alloalcanivorax marinus]MBL7250966.1 hypothetical protein [Alloalcanivorax marinus]